MKSSTPIFKILSVVVLIAVGLYFSVQLYRYVSNPFTTATVYRAQAEDVITMNGYLVRQEETFSSELTTLSHVQTEGAKVGIGQTIAVAYPSEAALDTVAELEALELQKEQLQFALESYLDKDAALKLDDTIHGQLLTLRRGIADGDYSGVGELSDLKGSVLKRDYSYSSADQVEADIKTVEQQISSLQATLSGAVNITAPASGVYSALCDGYETVLSPDMLQEMTLADYRAITASGSDANVGKLIYGDRWYYVTTIRESDAELLKGKSRVTIRFAKGLDMDVTMEIDRLTKPENGECLLILHSDRYLSQTTLLRHQTAEILLREYEGLWLPATALRVNEDGVAGVFCVTGATARFKPVTVTYQRSGYILVAAADTSGGTAVLRVGDEVIITNGELYDGKVIGS